MALKYTAPKSLLSIPLTCREAIQELWKGRSWVMVSDEETNEAIRLNRTPDNNFLLMAPMMMVEFADVEMAMNVAEQVLRGQLTLEQVRELYPPTIVREASPPT